VVQRLVRNLVVHDFLVIFPCYHRYHV
jgi:hypothetical protein